MPLDRFRGTRPLLAITQGDPAGIGPETIAGALHDRRVIETCLPVVIGRAEVLQRAIALLKLPKQVVAVRSMEEVAQVDSSGGIAVLSCGSEQADRLKPAVADAIGGQAAYDALVTATRYALDGDVDGIVTAPLHKGALHAAGHRWPGHTELLAELCGVQQYAMMLYLPPVSSAGGAAVRHGGASGLGVVHVTLHMALREVFEHLTCGAIQEKIALAHEALGRIRIAMNLSAEPRIAVAALNPHGGEGGLFGDEESTIIAPAVAWGKSQGWDVEGPLPVDTLMPRAADGLFDVVVAMYHDQGHIALKLLDMFEAVNVTLGLPIIRTSVAHGTAFDLAWQGKASHGGMVQAILCAARMARGGFYWGERSE